MLLCVFVDDCVCVDVGDGVRFVLKMVDYCIIDFC